MARRVIVFFIAIMLAVPLVARAQTGSHPDFTGTWKVTNIDMPETGGGFGGADRGGFGGRGGSGGRGGRQTDDRLIVTQDDGQGVVTMSSYGLDGKESDNRTAEMTTKSKTKWEGVALVTDMTRAMETGRGNFEMKSREVRSLSDDGRTMTVRTTTDTPRGKQTMTVTYTKIDQ